jgi:hypothetical protein
LVYALREEQIISVFENWVLRKIFGPQREEVAGSWRRLRIEERHQMILGRSSQGE